MELTDDIRKAALKELVEQFKEAADHIKESRKDIAKEWEITADWLEKRLHWYDSILYKSLKEAEEEMKNG